MRIKAYILAADPAWIEESVLSYYDMVEEIVVSYDRSKRGLTGVPIAVDECLARLHTVDHDQKMRFVPGDYARLDFDPMENETYQRQCALNEASSGADWVLQLDTDEVLADSSVFLACLAKAENAGAGGMDYPARYLYRQLGNNRYLELCSRFWHTMAGFPGPVAVRPSTQLRHARQCDVPLFRVDFSLRSTSTWHPKNVSVHQAIKPNQGIYHFSWVRDEQLLRNKLASWSHANHRDWSPVLKHWLWSGQHPYLAILRTPFAPRDSMYRLRISSIPHPGHLGLKPSENRI